MAKKSKKANALDKAQQKLAKAQLALHVAQEKRTQAITKGEREVERARQRAAAREAKATTRVEKRASAVARAEADVSSLTAKQQAPRRSTPTPVSVVAPAAASTATATPQSAADTLQQEIPPPDAGPLIVPNSVEVITGDEIEQLDTNSGGSSGPTW